MKRVSFKVAQAIKEAGYPQYRDNRTVLYPTRGEFKGILCGYNSAAPERDKDSINAPTYLEVWLWLVREKNILLRIAMTTEDQEEICWNCFCKNPYIFLERPDPEDVIIAAIEYLVDNNLIK